MRLFGRLAAALAMLLGFASLLYGGLAFAADTSPAAAVAADPAAYGINTASMIALILLTIASVVVRKVAPSASFLHTAWGATLLSFMSGAFTLLAQAWQANGVSLKSTLPALLAAAMSLAGSSNPSVPAGEVDKMTRLARGRSRGSARLGIMLALALVGCGAGGAAYLRCELGALPQTLQSVIATVTAIASQSANAVQDLVAFGVQVTPQQVDCVAQALLANVTPPKAAGAVDQPAWVVRLRANLGDYLAQRKAQGASLKCEPGLLEAAQKAAPLWAGTGPGVAQVAGDCACGDLECVKRTTDRQLAELGQVAMHMTYIDNDGPIFRTVAGKVGRYVSLLGPITASAGPAEVARSQTYFAYNPTDRAYLTISTGGLDLYGRGVRLARWDGGASLVQVERVW